MTLFQLIQALAEEKVSVSGSGVDERGLFFTVDGFSKSGSVKLHAYGQNNVLCTARYDEETIVHTVEELARVAWTWFTSHSDQKVFSEPSPIWRDLFIKYGWLDVHTKNTYAVSASAP